MGEIAYQNAVYHALTGRPHLLPVFGDVWGVASAVRAYSPDLFLVLNVGRNMDEAEGREPRSVPVGVTPIHGAWYEIHSTEERPTLVTPVRFDALDCRVVQWLRQSDIRVHGAKFLQDWLHSNERQEAKNKRDLRNQTEAWALDNRLTFKKAGGGVGYIPVSGTPTTA